MDPLRPEPTHGALDRTAELLAKLLSGSEDPDVTALKEGPYQDRPPLCPFRLLPLLIYSGSTIAFLKILKVQGPKSKNIENVILPQP